MLLKKNNTEFFFVHIPRTAGRYVSKLFEKNNFKFADLSSFEKYCGVEKVHLHHDLLKDFDKYNKSKKFTIVRDPLEKFISAATIDLGLNKKNFSLEFDSIQNILNYVKLNNEKSSNNWFRPQHEFISEDCKIWKYEDGFFNKFSKFIFDNFNIQIKFFDVDCKNSYDDVFKKINVTKKIKEAIKIIYKKDYDILNYK